MKKRRYAKRKTRQIYKAMDKAMEHILEVHEMFDDEDHTDLAGLLDKICQLQLMVQAQVVGFYKRTWGRVPGDWYDNV